MVRKTKGFRSGTRNKLRKKGKKKVTVNQFLEEFKEGERVLIKIEPSSHKGMPHPKFKGKYGTVIERRGRAYIVEIKDGKVKKDIIANPEHLKHA
ncbi:MAG: 50S ribosomal protein L21e [Candidatus Aenigmarchaeota archaeon]|nr:50S ribosomal protein L21e [Candidatus Aenigmarchaeota archaeon]